MLAAMNRDVVEKARQQKEELIDTFLADLVKQLRGLVYEVTTNVLASIETNQGRLVGKASVQLSNLIEQVASLNFFGDQEIDRMIARVRMELARQPEDRDVKEIQAQLKNMATITRATLIGLGEQPRSARSLGVADAPTPEMIRTARRGLGLGEEIEMPELELRGRRIAESQPEGG